MALAPTKASYTNISYGLSSACCALLSTGPSQASDDTAARLAEVHQTEPWAISIGAGNYIEKDRNTGIEVILNASRPVEEDRLNLRVELDVITGATPNGATASNVPQTFTMASGVGTYSVGANELPADDTHMDTRLGIATVYNDRFESDFAMSYRGHLSMEWDYFSLGAGIDFVQEFNQRNTSIILGLDYEYNRVHPVGNIPIPFASMQPPGAQQPRGEASVTKKVRGASFGFTQILNPRSLLQVKYSYAKADGYLTDPYKLLSVIESPTGSTVDYLYENRPGQRTMESIYTAYKQYIEGDVLDLSYRHYWDEWDIRSDTVEIRYHRQLLDDRFLQPSFRFYSQTAASFFRHSLPEIEALPRYASADFRLAAFDAYTIGMKFGKRVGDFKEHSLNLEYYTQIGNSYPDDAIGLQKEQDLFPTLHTLVLFYNYSFLW